MYVARLEDEAIVPKRAHQGDAGFDLHSIESGSIPPGETTLFGTGLVFEVPKSYATLILPRSGLSVKKGITIPNSPGLIDCEYRGEIKVALHNTTSIPYHVEKFDRIAQAMFIQIAGFGLQEKKLEDIKETQRGSGGFGSSGK